MDTRARRLFLPGALLALGWALRLGHWCWGTPLEQALWSDMGNYVFTADSLGRGAWREQAFFQPVGYPLAILVLKRWMAGGWAFHLSLLQCLASCATLVFIWRAAHQSLGPRAGLATLAIAAIHLPWIYFNNYALPETFYTLLLAMCAWAGARLFYGQGGLVYLYAFGWGASFGAALWLKATHALLGPLMMAALLWFSGRRRWAYAATLTLPVAASLALHGALTYKKVGKVQLGASASGLNFMEGKCPFKRNSDNTGYSWYSPLYSQIGLDGAKHWERPFTDSAYYWYQGLGCVEDDPWILVQSLENLPYLFFNNRIWPLMQKPNASLLRLYELALACWLICGLATFFRDLMQRFDTQRFLTWGLPVVALFLCAYIFKAEARYRVPFDVWLIPMSVAGWRSFADPILSTRESATGRR